MKHKVLTIASLLSILFLMSHLAGDIVYGYEPGTPRNLIAVPIIVIWLYGTLELGERRSGYIIILLGSLLSSLVPIAHMMGRGIGLNSRLANTSGHFLFVWTILALGVTALFSVIISVRRLWSFPWRQRRSANIHT